MDDRSGDRRAHRFPPSLDSPRCLLPGQPDRARRPAGSGQFPAERKVCLRPVPEPPPAGAGLALPLGRTQSCSGKAPAALLHLSTSRVSWKPPPPRESPRSSCWWEEFLGSTTSGPQGKLAGALASQPASPPPPREAAAHGMGVCVRVFLWGGRAEGGDRELLGRWGAGGPVTKMGVFPRPSFWKPRSPLQEL